MQDERPTPVELKLDTGERSSRIVWDDDHVSTYAWNYLRALCPCVTCVGGHGAQHTDPKSLKKGKSLPIFDPEAQKADTLVGAEPAGDYAIVLLWGDGHDTAYYMWDYLLEICPCPRHADVDW